MANASVAQRAMMQKRVSREGSLAESDAIAAARAVALSAATVRRRRAVIWHDLNDETKYKRARGATATPTCVPEKREDQADSLVFPEGRFSPSLSLSLSLSSVPATNYF